MEYDLRIRPTTSDRVIVVICMITAWLIIIFCVYGVWALFWGVPNKKVEIKQLKIERHILQDQIVTAVAKVEAYKTAMRFENLFLLTADHNNLMDFDVLEDYLCEKRGLCKAVE